MVLEDNIIVSEVSLQPSRCATIPQQSCAKQHFPLPILPAVRALFRVVGADGEKDLSDLCSREVRWYLLTRLAVLFITNQ